MANNLPCDEGACMMAIEAENILATGIAPSWFPPDKKIDCRGKRRDLLRSMTLVDLRITVEEIIEMHHEHFANLNYCKHEYRPATINGIEDVIGHDCAILARYMYAATLGEEIGLPLLIGNDHADRVIKGDNYATHQGKIAKNQRGRIGDAEQTNDQIIGELAMAAVYRKLSAKELWDHYYSRLDQIGCDPKTDEANHDWRKWTIWYDFKDGRKPITGGQFANVVSEYRNGKKSG